MGLELSMALQFYRTTMVGQWTARTKHNLKNLLDTYFLASIIEIYLNPKP